MQKLRQNLLNVARGTTLTLTHTQKYNNTLLQAITHIYASTHTHTHTHTHKHTYIIYIHAHTRAHTTHKYASRHTHAHICAHKNIPWPLWQLGLLDEMSKHASQSQTFTVRSWEPGSGTRGLLQYSPPIITQTPNYQIINTWPPGIHPTQVK